MKPPKRSLTPCDREVPQSLGPRYRCEVTTVTAHHLEQLWALGEAAKKHLGDYEGGDEVSEAIGHSGEASTPNPDHRAHS
ncbi:hypothetical protein CesoFtcFv8_025545 [Champsocephalus esox]|uniref:Uncharacterized protein n=1 Tax=Champsocephalus esox TaxID=159716 RepID=A0AAN8GF86_9TELE|nr:hypothetical protein CesoFtcFv8_025545 [Champsocephalus esox]